MYSKELFFEKYDQTKSTSKKNQAKKFTEKIITSRNIQSFHKCFDFHILKNHANKYGPLRQSSHLKSQKFTKKKVFLEICNVSKRKKKFN